MPEEYIWRYFIQIARGIHALHALKILHRDIKPGNLMVTDRDVVKIGDLGISKVLKHTMAKTQIGEAHHNRR
jgi:NIMA (never in mitosis gene a)-related kinase 1/4/5